MPANATCIHARAIFALRAPPLQVFSLFFRAGECNAPRALSLFSASAARPECTRRILRARRFPSKRAVGNVECDFFVRGFVYEEKNVIPRFVYEFLNTEVAFVYRNIWHCSCFSTKDTFREPRTKLTVSRLMGARKLPSTATCISRAPSRRANNQTRKKSPPACSAITSENLVFGITFRIVHSRRQPVNKGSAISLHF